jgi:DNA mismatch repair protein MutS2
MVDLELLPEDEMRRLEEPQREAVSVSAWTPSPGSEISLRGQRYEEAQTRLDHYLDQAYTAGLPYVRIIHGKGTGKLREMVREELKRREFVERYEEAQPHEGGEGVTVAFFNGN